MAVKEEENIEHSENNKNIILRCYECHGEAANLDLDGDLDLNVIEEVDCLEEKKHQNVNTTIEPWEVKSFRLNIVNE